MDIDTGHVHDKEHNRYKRETIIYLRTHTHIYSMDIDTGDVHDYAHTHTYIAWILIQEMYMTQNTIDTRERQNPKSRI